MRVNGRLLLAIGNLSAIAPTIATLRQGYNRLELEYSSPATGPSDCRLWWTDGTFAPEPVPPTVLWHDKSSEDLQAAESFRRGLFLASELRCSACHSIPGQRKPPLPTAPSLAGAGSRLESRWIYDWLLDPQAIRPQAHMPRLFDAEKAADRQAAADIAGYLMTLTSREGEARVNEQRAEPRGSAGASPSQTLTSQPSPSGAALFEDLACVACHRLTPPTDDDKYYRLSLAHVAAKFHPGQLAEFLLKPQARYAATHMPDFQLSDAEASALAAHLLAARRPDAPAGAELASADARRGEALFRELKCDACHANSDNPPAPNLQARAVALANLTRGCLSAEAKSRGKAPQYSLSQFQIADLRACLGREELDRPSITQLELLPHILAAHRCGACHTRDHEVAPLRRIVAEESDHGIAPEGIPNLTWAGEKLHGQWLRKQLAGELLYRSRPWLKARMPAFPHIANLLTEGLASEHGQRPASENQVADHLPQLAPLGDRLTRKDGGLDCRSCHAVGKDQPTGDERTKVAQGINFAHTRERLRDDFYLRFVLDPPRHDVTTRMPKLSADGKTTNATAILDGDARQQFEAIWQFIQTVRE